MSVAVVIGGGVAGLATAALLARDGHRVRLLERGERLGGRTGTSEHAGFRFDTGPSWYLMPGVFEHFFQLLGTSAAEQLDLRRLDPGYRVFPEPDASGVRPDPVTVPAGRANVLRLFESLEPGSAAQLDRYLDSATRATAMAERFFLYNPFTRAGSLANRRVVGSAVELTGLLARSLESYVARRFRHPVLRQILGYPAVFLGTRPSDAPAMYHLMSALDLDEGVLYPMGGFWHLVERLEALARAEGVEIVTGAEVTRIDCRPGRTRRARGRVRGVRWTDSTGAEHAEPAEIVVSGADLHHTETTLLPDRFRSYPERWWHRRVSGPGAVLVLLGVRGRLPQLPHHSLLFTRDWQANFSAIFDEPRRIPDPPSLYVCKPSETDPSVAPEGHENLFVLIPVPADPAIGGAGDALVERTADAAIAQLASWSGIPDLADRIVLRRTIGPADFARDYHSWRGGMLGPAHLLRQSAMFRPQNASKRVDGLFYAGATTAPGVGVPMCLISAELVLKRVRGDGSAGPTAPRPPARPGPR